MEDVKETYKVKLGINKAKQKKVNQYTLVSKLGEGGHAKVMLGKNNKCLYVKFIKAIKIYKTDFLSRQKVYFKSESGDLTYKTALDSVQNEINMLKTLDHNNIIKIFEVLHDEDQGKIYLVMEYCEKGNLLTWNPSTSTFHPLWSKFLLTESLIRHIFRQLVFAVFYLHNQFIVHYDLKPQNILLTSSFNVKLIDFDKASNLVSENTIVKSPGTYHFFPPENVIGLKLSSSALCKAVDIWDLGLILFASVFGILPFNGQNMDDLFRSIRDDP
jgi:serine/threonine protein kinase